MGKRAPHHKIVDGKATEGVISRKKKRQEEHKVNLGNWRRMSVRSSGAVLKSSHFRYGGSKRVRVTGKGQKEELVGHICKDPVRVEASWGPRPKDFRSAEK